MSYFYSPLRYPGGKNCIFPFISKLFYENDLIGLNYAEPYAGGTGLALRLLVEGYVEHIYINDLDKCIYSFWKNIIDNPHEICNWLEKIEVTVTNWIKYKNILKAQDIKNSIELAKATFFLNRTNISGVIKGGVIGGFEQKGKYKIDARFNKEDLINRIQKISRLKERITVSNFDGLEFIRQLDKKKEEIFIYLDPPYFQKGAELYLNSYTKKDHKKLADKIHKLKKRWLVSYDNHDFILNLYADENRIVYRLSQSASNRTGDEIIIFPDNLVIANSISFLKSPCIISA